MRMAKCSTSIKVKRQCNRASSVGPFIPAIAAFEIITISRFKFTRSELVLKLQDTVAETLGRSLNEGLRVRFDRRLSASSLQFYDLRSIPAVRSEPPPAVSDIHFRSDLSCASQAETSKLIEREPSLADFLPKSDDAGRPSTITEPHSKSDRYSLRSMH